MTDVPPPEDALRTITAQLSKQLHRVTTKAVSGSPRAREIADVRSSPSGGGRARVDLLMDLSVDVVVMAANLSLFVEGVADCLQVAGLRDDAINSPVLSVTVRPALEIAGQIAWLIDDSIDGASRSRRYLIWRLADLRQNRLMLREFGVADETEKAAARADLDSREAELSKRAEAAKWNIRTTEYDRKGQVQAAVMLDAEGKPEGLPTVGELTRLVSGDAAVYSLLSVPTHGVRFGAFYGLEATDEKPDRDGRVKAHVKGFGLPPNLIIGLACLATVATGQRLAGWNGIDGSELLTSGEKLMKWAGFN